MNKGFDIFGYAQKVIRVVRNEQPPAVKVEAPWTPPKNASTPQGWRKNLSPLVDKSYGEGESRVKGDNLLTLFRRN